MGGKGRTPGIEAGGTEPESCRRRQTTVVDWLDSDGRGYRCRDGKTVTLTTAKEVVHFWEQLSADCGDSGFIGYRGWETLSILHTSRSCAARSGGTIAGDFGGAQRSLPGVESGPWSYARNETETPSSSCGAAAGHRCPETLD